MATNLKTIKFGENGETYAVNDYPVKVSGELTEEATTLDFGSFADGLTELRLLVYGVAANTGNYVIPVINGVAGKFVTAPGFYAYVGCLYYKKIGDIWLVEYWSSGQSAHAAQGQAMTELTSVDKITSFKLNAYPGTPFPVGTKYALEGR